MIIGQGTSHHGNVRRVNEDAWRLDASLGVFLVADGMGGHNAGEIASALAADTIVDFLRSSSEDADATWPFGLDPALSIEANRLRTGIRLGNRRVFQAALDNAEYTGMGTTVVAALVDADRLYFAGVGDSRMYLFHDGRLQQLTTDDSWVSLLEPGDPAHAVPAKHPMRHVLTNAVGTQEQVEFAVLDRVLEDNDLLLLCSDGLHGELDDETTAEILREGGEPGEMADRLLQAALAGRAADNVTALVVRYTRG